MKILHTADWHLGKKLDNYSRIDEQIMVMNEIIEKADQQQADIIIIAGDLFDSFNPNTESIELFYKSLKRLSLNGARPVIAIAGNHDSPALIDAPDPLARECGIILIGYPKAEVKRLKLNNFEINHSEPGFIELKLSNFNYPIRILHTAYANEIRLKQYLGEDKSVAINEALAHHWQDIADKYCDDKGVNILTTHLYMNKKGEDLLEEPEGERPIKIGNADLVYTDSIPSQIQYTALGHLHRYQNIGTTEKPIVYSSSPLAYSFSEAGQTKYVVWIEAKPKEQVKFEREALKSGLPLHRKTFDNIDNAIGWLSENPNTLVELTLESDTFLKAEDRKRIYQTHNGIIHIIPKIKQQSATKMDFVEVNLDKDTKELFKEYFSSKHKNQEPNEDLMNLFNEILTTE